MYFTVYKITNKLNGRFYIGMHKTAYLNDGYMGSGKLIKHAIHKYGLENFSKEILFIFDNENDMKNKEKELVTLTEDSYNLCDGGKGGFGYINRSALSKFKGKKHSAETKEIISSKLQGNKSFSGKKHSDESKRKIGESTRIKLTGSPKSEDHKRRISEAIKKKNQEKRGVGI